MGELMAVQVHLDKFNRISLTDGEGEKREESR